MADTTLNDALSLLTTVSSKLGDRIVALEKAVGKTVGLSTEGIKKQPERIVEESKPVIVTDFGVKAKQDLRDVLKPSIIGEGKDFETGKAGMGFLTKLIGPALLVLGGLAALVQGLMTDGSLKGLFNILSKGGIVGGVKLFQKLAGKQIGKFTTMFAKILPKDLFKNVIDRAKGFLKNIGKFLLAPFEKIAGKGGSKALFGTISKLFTQTLTPLLKRIPGIGSLISWSFAVSRFKSGDLVGGLIDVASGIATLFPGIGTGISIGLDVLNAFLDLKKDPEEVKAKGEKFNLGKFFGNIKDAIMNNFPIKNLVEFWTGAGNVVKGNMKEGFKQMAYAIPFMEPLSEFIFNTTQESKDEDGKFSFKQFFGNIKNKLLRSMLNILPKSILGVSVRARAAKLLGIDMGPVEDDTQSIELSERGNKFTQELNNAGVKVSSNGVSDSSLDKDTFVKVSQTNLKIGSDQMFELKKNNILLTQILEKINTGGTVINTTNSSVIQSSDNNTIRQFRERYA